MSPDRQRTPSCEAKPYSRQATPDTTNTPSEQRSTAIAYQETSQSTAITSKPGFPTYAQYKQLEANYLASLQPNRREKALISQSLFDRIWAVLHTPDKTTETPQFRFWVRKKFAFGTVAAQKSPNLDEDASTSSDSESESAQTVLLHEENLVAVQEQIYDILCYSHGTTHHAGRDKTCQTVRQHYTWIPKELVARFIKACPTCIAKKCGVKKDDMSATYILPSLRQFLRSSDSEDDEKGDLHLQGVDGSPMAAEDSTVSEPAVCDLASEPARASRPEALDRGENQSAAPESLKSPNSLPMSREVSLYQGLPNGWQFRHDDFNVAQDEFVHHRKVSPDPSYPPERARRPRVPSIAPVVRDLGTRFTNVERMVLPFEVDPERVLPPLLRQVPRPQDRSLPSLRFNSVLFPLRDGVTPLPARDAETRAEAPPSIHRAGAPPPINLRYLNSQKTIQAFLTLRDTHSLTPDSPPVSGAPLASPTNSECSQLSSFPMMTTDSISPANTALATPTDDTATTGLGLDMSLDAQGGVGPKEKAVSLILGERVNSESASVISL